MIILKKEGCVLNADFINILKESKPDSVSKCYRCSAEFYKYKKRLVIISPRISGAFLSQDSET